MIGWPRTRHADVGQPPDPFEALAWVAFLFLVLALVGWAYYGVR